MNRAETHLECAGRAIAATALSSGGRHENFLARGLCESGVAAIALPPQSKWRRRSDDRRPEP